MKTKLKHKVDGSGRTWHIFEWRAHAMPKNVPAFYSWVIVKGPYLTKARALKEMGKLE